MPRTRPPRRTPGPAPPTAAPTAADVTRVAAAPITVLYAELAARAAWSAVGLLHMALVWAELERRGADLAAHRGGVYTYLPLINCGAVAPEAVLRFMGRAPLLRAVCRLPVPIQLRLAADDTVSVVCPRGADGATTVRRLSAHALSDVHLRQVFGDRAVRTEAEQRAWIAAGPRPRRTPAAQGTTLPAPGPAEMRAALLALAGPAVPPAGELPHGLTVYVSAGEERAVRLAAVAASLSISTYLRHTLKAVGVLP